MKKLLLVLLSAWPCAATLTISSATMPTADGRAFNVVMSSAYVSGATTGCFTFSGGSATPVNAAAATAVWTTGTTATVTTAAPFYVGDVPVVSLVASPTCGLIGAGGIAATSNATATNNSDYRAAGDAFWATRIRYQGSPSNATDGNGYPHAINFASPTGSMDFALSTGGTACVWMIQYDNAVSLYTAGVVVSRTALASATTYTEVCNTVGIATQSLTQSSSVSHYGGGPGPSQATAGFTAFRCTSCVFTTLPAANPVIAAIGASYVDLTDGGGATPNVDRNEYGLLKAVMGVTVQGHSQSGVAFCPVTAGHISFTAAADMGLAGGATPILGKMEPDPNDIISGVTQSVYTACITTAINAIMASATAPPHLLVWGMYPINFTGSQCASGCTTLYNGWMKTGVANAANANVIYIDTSALPNGGADWIDGLETNSGCNTVPNTGTGDLIATPDPSANHPCPATAVGQLGYGKMANREIPLIAGFINGSSWTVSGTTSGTVIVNLTLTLPNSATWFDRVTYTSSNVLDTVCLGASCGTGSATLPASQGANTVPLTITSNTAGSRTLTPSAAPAGWQLPTATTISLSGGTITPKAGTFFLGQL